MSGFEVLRRIRERSWVPILMLTARGDDVDRIVGLEMGADDYLPKPFNPREMVARIRAIQRRADAGSARSAEARNRSVLAVGDVVLDPSIRTVEREGQTVQLTSAEFSLLEALLTRAGEVVAREELSQRALGRPLSALDRSIDVHVSSLRRKLGSTVGGVERIQTVRGVGYLYAALPPRRGGGKGSD
jgi:two-component system response regulator CpxR